MTIAPSGEVGFAAITRSSVRDTGVASCFLEAIRRWRFPYLHGQSVTVIQRFTLI